jgi:phage FluMu protein Com
VKLSQEILNHFGCEHCKRWWSMGSVKFELGQQLNCPWCGELNTITEIDTTGNLTYAQHSHKAITVDVEP